MKFLIFRNWFSTVWHAMFAGIVIAVITEIVLFIAWRILTLFSHALYNQIGGWQPLKTVPLVISGIALCAFSYLYVLSRRHATCKACGSRFTQTRTPLDRRHVETRRETETTYRGNNSSQKTTIQEIYDVTMQLKCEACNDTKTYKEHQSEFKFQYSKNYGIYVFIAIVAFLVYLKFFSN